VRASGKTGGGAWSRLLPARLSTRLTVSIVVTAAVTFVLVATIIGVSLSYQTRSVATVTAGGQYAEARNQLDLRSRQLDALLMALTDWDTFYTQTSTPDGQFTDREFDPWLRDRAAASTIVWMTADGTVLNSYGNADDVDALVALARRKTDGARGPMSLPSGPAVVAVRPIIGDPPKEAAGYVAVARTVSTDWFETSGLGTIAVTPTDTLPEAGPGWSTVDPPHGYDVMLSMFDGGFFVTRAALRGIDGSSVLVLESSRPDPWLGEGRAWTIVLVPLAIGLVVLGIAYLLGSALGRDIVRPLRSFVKYIQDQGYLALQGLRTDEELLIEPGLPEDFANLGEVITDLMTQLRINQSELIEAGDQALAAERAFRTVVEESPEVKILVRSGVVEIANPAAAHFFGLQLGDLLRAEPAGLFSGIRLLGEDDTPLDLLNVARQAHDTPVVARCVTPDQPDRWIELSVAFIDPMGADYVMSARNITEERRLEALRQEVLSLVSHDLRSPLTVVRGYLDILDRPLDDERRTTAIDSARRAAQRMEGLLDDLLHATRAEAVFAPRVMRPVDLSVLVEGVATALQMSVEQDIITSLEPGVMVLGDPFRLEQAVTNLIGNAIKHGPAQGEVRVSVETRNDRVVVSIEDDGPGIPADQREHVFQRGTRGSASQSTPGMGLGLYIVRVVAEAHGGLAYVDDSDSGTRFVLDLPIVRPDGNDV
jgi:signal transduction histidine kinase